MRCSFKGLHPTDRYRTTKTAQIIQIRQRCCVKIVIENEVAACCAEIKRTGTFVEYLYKISVADIRCTGYTTVIRVDFVQNQIGGVGIGNRRPIAGIRCAGSSGATALPWSSTLGGALCGLSVGCPDDSVHDVVKTA